jgi:hypothetical protein
LTWFDEESTWRCPKEVAVARTIQVDNPEERKVTIKDEHCSQVNGTCVEEVGSGQDLRGPELASLCCSCCSCKFRGESKSRGKLQHVDAPTKQQDKSKITGDGSRCGFKMDTLMQLGEGGGDGGSATGGAKTGVQGVVMRLTG